MPSHLPRLTERQLHKLISYFPVVAVVGPRQVGKTSLVKSISGSLKQECVYLDLENPTDQARLRDPYLYLGSQADKMVIIDEVQREPTLFPVLRSLIDQDRRAGRFILLGSASPDLIRDSSESLAGRIAYLELHPLAWREVEGHTTHWQHWVRGGFPDALFAPDDELSRLWRQNFIQTYLERDLPLLGLRANPMVIGRLWRMLAHWNGQLLNAEKLGGSLGVTGNTVRGYLDFLESAFLIRRLPPYVTNLKKRLVKSPKVYLRDTGVLHQLLGITDFNALSGHPVLGASWENYVIEQISILAPDWADLYFYRTHQGTEVDLVITRGGEPAIIVEIKYTTSPRITKSMRIAAEDLGRPKQFVICPINEGFLLSEDIRVLGFSRLEEIFT